MTDDEGRPKSAPHHREIDARSVPPRAAPALLLRLELEQPGYIVLDADTHEDELRLRGWLRRSDAFHELPGLLGRLLDDLDELDAAA